MKGSAADAALFSFPGGRAPVLVGVEGVADGSAEPKNIAGVEVGVVYDVVEMRLGADENPSPQSVLDAGSKVQQEVIAVQVGGAA